MAVQRLRLFSKPPRIDWLVLAGTLLLLAPVDPAKAAVVLTAEKVGTDVVISGGGTLDLTDLTFGFEIPNQPGVEPNFPFIQVGPTGAPVLDAYTGAAAPGPLGPGGLTLATAGTGDPFAANGIGIIAVPTGFVSGNAVMASSTYAGQTFGSLGMTPGTYVWSWGSGSSADSLTLNIVAPTPPNLEMFVASGSTDQILRFDGNSGVFFDLFAFGGGVDVPIGIRFGPDGNLYVSSALTDQVLRYDGTTGAFIDVFASGGGLDLPHGLVFGPDGHLYVASASASDQVLRYSGATGAFLGVFASGGGLDGPNGLSFGPDGHLYVASGDTNQVLRYNGTTGAFIDVFASGGGLNVPTGLTFGPDGHLYVGGRFNDAVLRYDGTTGAFIDVFASGGGVVRPDGPTFGPDGNLYVSSESTGEVLRYNGTTGAFIDVFAAGGGLSGPRSMIFRCTGGTESIAWWTANADVFDIAGGRHAALENGGGFDSGRVGKAFRLDGSDDFLAVPDDDIWTFGGEFTISLWINFDTVQSGSPTSLPNVFVGHDDGPGSTEKWIFFYDGSRPAFHMNGTGGSVFLSSPSAFPATVGQWHHFAVTRSGTSYTFFADGQSLGSVTDSRPLPNAAVPLTMGQAEGLGYVDGRLDEIQLFDRALTASEVGVLFAAPGCEKPLAVPALPGWALGVLAVVLAAAGFACVRLRGRIHAAPGR